jgi:hypothetical protein
MALNLQADHVGVVVFGNDSLIHQVRHTADRSAVQSGRAPRARLTASAMALLHCSQARTEQAEPESNSV